ncbi:MAG: LuxR C-terminal-related transcriptional regulator [Synergistaceae bacterium]|jgi:LuxR family maltose regulon positive regulatory protein|nr:LuxR C-terminal-related transcriptional regulator [Synergistaceae bacterium]
MSGRFVYSNTSAIFHDHVCLERPHLHKLLEEYVQSPLVTVVAGAGYGKTEAVYSFLKKYDAVTAWMQLSERDNLGSRFWENYTYTISLYNKRFAAKLTEVGFPETEGQFYRYLPIPEDEILPSEKYVFVFDDFHLIRDLVVLRFLERSVNAFFPNVTTIIISRNEPPINTVGLLSKGLRADIDEKDLRFTEREMLSYFHMQGIDPSPQAASDIYNGTEGWAFAIGLAGLSLKKRPIRESYALSAMKNNVFKLIESEVFFGISEALRKFLVALSLVDHLSSDFVEDLSSDKNVMEGFTAETARLGSFIRYDSYMNEYRIHPLFWDYLRRRQDMLTEDEKRGVYLKAARWCVENNYKMDAIAYCAKAQVYDQIIDIVYTLQLMLPDKTASFLLELFQKIPKDAYEKNATLCLLRARFLGSLGRFDEAVAELKALIKKYEAQPASPFSCRLLCGAYNNLGFIHYCNCMYAHDYEFWRYFEKSAHYYPLSKYVVEGPVTNVSIGPYACRIGKPEKGNIEKFVDAMTISAFHVSTTMSGCSYGVEELLRAEVAYFKGDVKNCEKFSYLALYKAREKGQYEIENRSLFFLLRVALGAGNYPKIQNLCKQLELQIDKTDYVNRHTLYDIVMGWYYITIRQPRQVAAWLKNDFEKSDINFLMQGLENVVKVKYYLSEKKYHALLAFLKSQEDGYGLGAFLFGKIGLKIMEAFCQYHLDEKGAAMTAFQTAYEMAEPNGLDMFFIEQGNDMRALANAAIKNNHCAIPRQWLEKIRKKSTTYAKKLAYVISEYRNANHLGDEIHLTAREMEILTDMHHGLSRTEIAAHRDLSINTVKAALQMIYTKLRAADGADALRIAASLKLLE